MEILIDQEKRNLKFETYSNGNIAIMLTQYNDEFGFDEPYDCPTRNIEGLQQDELALRNYQVHNYSEIFEKLGIVEKPHRYIRSGIVNFPIHKLTPKFSLLLKKS